MTFWRTFAAAVCISGATFAQTLQETHFWQVEVDAGTMPAVADRMPDQPLIVDLASKGRDMGQQGGNLRTMITRSKDIRQMVVYGYARLIGYDENYQLVADVLKSFDVEEGRKFTFTLRDGHKWSDGAPLTSDDFRYWWDDVANNPELSPAGPPDFLKLGEELPTVRFPDERTIVYEWSKPNPGFLPRLAQARPPFIYRPAHFLKKYHATYADPDKLAERVAKKKVRSWAALHNKRDNMYKFNNPNLPTLQPWVPADVSGETRRLFVRNPFYHRADSNGVQLPYIDTVEMFIVGRGLVAAKSNAGETDLQARGLNFKDIPVLKKGELDGGNYVVHLWPNGTASQIAIFLNFNHNEPVMRKLNRDVRFRRALSMGIDRNIINRALYFDLGKAANMTALSASPFYSEENATKWTEYDTAAANALLDEIGFTERRGDGIRMTPDETPLRVLIETAGEREEVENALEIIRDSWREIGVELITRPLDRDILRQHVYSGQAQAAVWFGWDNGLPTPATSPAYLAPRAQEFFTWPKWGQHHQTSGDAGEPIDMELPQKLYDLSAQWETATDDATRSKIWAEMLAIHADQVYGIGIVNEAPQPVVVSKRLRNVPKAGLWAWEPGAHFGIHRADEFWFAE